MEKVWTSLLATFFFVCTVNAADNKKEAERVENSGKVMTEILNIPEDVPHDLLDKASCVIVLRRESCVCRWRRLRPRSDDLP